MHYTACLNSYALRIKRGKSTSDFIRIYELPAIKDFRKNGVRRRCFSSAVATTNDIQIKRHFP